jgi:transcription elongation factor GreA
MSKPIYLTKERLQELEAELILLKGKGRTEIAEKIALARSHGDLRENGDYDAAKEEQGMLELKIAKLEQTLSHARTVRPEDFPADKVYILSKVRLLNKKTNQEIEYLLVSPEEADFEKNKIAVSSPVGKSLLGKVIGDEVSVRVPAGQLEFKILDISR